MKKNVISLLLFSLILLLLSACGDDSNAESDSEVRSIKVAVPPTSKPLSYEEDGKLTGYEPEILRLVDEKLEDYKFDIVGVSDSAGEVGLSTGKYDMLAQGAYKTDEREEKYLIPSESNGASLMKIYTNDTNIKGVKDLVGRKIVPTTPSGGVFNFLQTWNEEHPSHELDIPTSDAGISYADRLKEVVSGKYDALVLPANLGQKEVIKREKLDIHITEPVKIFPTYFLIHKDEKNKELTEKVSNAISELKEEGKLSEISMEFYDEDIFKYD